MRRWYFVVGAIAIVAIVWWWRSTDRETPAATTHARDDAAERTPVTAPPRPVLRAQSGSNRATRGAPAIAFDASVQHTADPCTALVDASVPVGYESVTVRGITLAWSPDGAAAGAFDSPLRPSSLASLIAGIVDEAAQLTGTEPRAELTVIVDPSRDEYRTRTRAPHWSSGVYDGATIRLFAVSGEDMGLVVSTLRHEVMHAQLHAAVGCMPWWFNEGLAQYFAGTPPMREWLAMLRSPEAFSLDAIQDPAIREQRTEVVSRSYAWSLAMVLYIIERAGEPGLRSAAGVLAAADSRRDAIALWDKTYPRIGTQQVLDTLATKLFGKPRDALADVLVGPLCCHGLRDIKTAACRATEARATTKHWFEGTAPRALCENRW